MKKLNKNLNLISPYPLDECHRRLKDSVNTSWFPYFSSYSVVGRVYERSFKIAKKVTYRNSFQTFLNASFGPDPQGTRITGSFGMHPVVIPFMTVWFGMVTLGLVFSLVNLFSHYWGDATRNVEWMGIVIPWFLLLVGFLLITTGRCFARGEDRYLKSFLIELLDAREVPAYDQGNQRPGF